MSREQLREFNIYDFLRAIYKKGPEGDSPSYTLQLHMNDTRVFSAWRGGPESAMSYNEFLNVVAVASSTTYDAPQRLQALRRVAFNCGYTTKVLNIEPNDVASNALEEL